MGKTSDFIDNGLKIDRPLNYMNIKQLVAGNTEAKSVIKALMFSTTAAGKSKIVEEGFKRNLLKEKNGFKGLILVPG